MALASAARRAFATSARSSPRRVFTCAQTRQRVYPHQSQNTTQRPWGHERILFANAFCARGYHGGNTGGSSGQSWDGLVYAIMANIRGEYNFGPECFLSATASDTTSDSSSSSTDDSDDDEYSENRKDGRRDMRALVPLRLYRPWLLSTAADIHLRLSIACASVSHTSDYAAVLSMLEMMEKLGNMEEDNPKLELREYREIFITLRDGLRATDEMPIRVVSAGERPAILNVQFAAECVWGVAVVNAALRQLEGTKVGHGGREGGDYGQDGIGVDDDELTGKTFHGDLLMLSGNINGLLLDSKDNFPGGEKWFGKEDEERILETVVRVMKEAAKRRGW